MVNVEAVLSKFREAYVFRILYSECSYNLIAGDARKRENSAKSFLRNQCCVFSPKLIVPSRLLRFSARRQERMSSENVFLLPARALFGPGYPPQISKITSVFLEYGGAVRTCKVDFAPLLKMLFYHLQDSDPAVFPFFRDEREGYGQS